MICKHRVQYQLTNYSQRERPRLHSTKPAVNVHKHGGGRGLMYPRICRNEVSFSD